MLLPVGPENRNTRPSLIAAGIVFILVGVLILVFEKRIGLGIFFIGLGCVTCLLKRIVKFIGSHH